LFTDLNFTIEKDPIENANKSKIFAETPKFSVSYYSYFYASESTIINHFLLLIVGVAPHSSIVICPKCRQIIKTYRQKYHQLFVDNEAVGKILKDHTMSCPAAPEK
jgi:hypothetical protein